ncbi:protein FAR1-RELATED SEQUENCE 1-like [Pistacia vera]|uniref:protein FAR1-RELATED SEQUENCE 1-like n=1 Tax=Pistacia vera TaxID=55513 RepID=UPI001263A3BB|nr:protein FAR1-RELATED SEQUENCE 1-like [Pistacia vera]
MEKQFQEAYTTTKFKEFQQKLTAKLHCELSSLRATESEIEYIVKEVVVVGETCHSVPFVVCCDDRGCDVRCNCRLFEFRGIICGHVITVLLRKEIYHIPEKFILRRWRKNVYRCHTKIRVNYNSWSTTAERERFDQLSNSFSEVVDLASINIDDSNMVMHIITDMKKKLLSNERAGRIDSHGDMSCHSDQILIVFTPIPQRWLQGAGGVRLVSWARPRKVVWGAGRRRTCPGSCLHAQALAYSLVLVLANG